MRAEISTKRDSCRVCGNSDTEIYLDLGRMPLANNLNDTNHQALLAPRFPLQVEFCHNCKLSQLTHVIDPEVLFGYYTYRSSINKGYRDHCKLMAESLVDQGMLKSGDFVIDIAGNDGALLKEFLEVVECEVLNIDPARNLCKIAEENGVKSYPAFWNHDTAKDVSKGLKPDVIISTNVFAHVDDIVGFIKGVKETLSDDGVWVLEFPYLVDLIERNEFDTVYFEHMSYLGIHPIQYLCTKVGLKICKIEKFSIHGGTVRLIISHTNSNLLVDNSVESYLKNESDHGFTSIEKYKQWSYTVFSVIDEFSKELATLKKKGYRIGAFAASAKGNTLLNSCWIHNDVIDFIADETPEKIGKFSPGTGIPIVHPDHVLQNPPDYIVILSWNFKQEIMDKLRPIYNGKFIVPIPHFEIV